MKRSYSLFRKALLLPKVSYAADSIQLKLTNPAFIEGWIFYGHH